jgi:hypothetical protein
MDRFCETRPLHRIVAENPHQNSRGFAPTQGSERFHGSDLLRNRMLQSESFEAPAQRLECGHSQHKTAAYSLCGYGGAVGLPDVWDCGNQRDIVQLAGRKTSRRFPLWRRGSRGDPAGGKKIKLMAR